MKLRILTVPFLSALLIATASAQYTRHRLVSNQSGVATFTDRHLVNVWGLVANPTSVLVGQRQSFGRPGSADFGVDAKIQCDSSRPPFLLSLWQMVAPDARSCRRFRDLRSRRRHYTRLIHLKCSYARLTFGVVEYDHHLVELDWDLYGFIHGIGFLKDRTGEDRPSTIAAPLL